MAVSSLDTRLQCKEIRSAELFMQFDVSLDIYPTTPGRYSVDASHTVLTKKVPEVLKVGPGINIAAPKFK